MEKIYKSEGMSSGAYKVQMVFSIIIGIIGAICYLQVFRNVHLLIIS